MVSADEQREIHELLLLNRLFEEKTLAVYEDRGIPELPHLSIGQEAVGVGATYAMRDDDWLAPSLRTRAVMLMRLPLRDVVTGMYGTQSSPTEGRTTQHHLGSSEHHILGTTGMIGSHLNVAAGAGLTAKQLDEDRVTAVFFGDGAATRGEFHTALNFSAVENLPVVFVLENNQWIEETPASKVIAVKENISEMAGHDLPTAVIDGQDVNEVHETVAGAADRARSGDGPTLIEAKTYRYRPHAEVIPERRPEDEIEEWRERDPVEIHRERLLDDDIVDEAWLEDTRESIEADVEDAFEFAEDDSLPDEEAMYKVYKDTDVDAHGGVRR
ncbi:MAG: thiamine pyrophosphate-dependent dehydrogenase E1 component subunit alpha [Halanaeroarchaeum sp.]